MKTDSQVNLSVYIPKYERRFILEVEAWQKEVYPDMKFSDFVLICIKNTINRLSPKETKKFEEVSLKLTQKLNPEAFRAAEKFLNKKGDRNGKTKA